MTEIKIFGIRHHGSGSSKRLLAGLEAFQPDVLAIELPAESDKLIPLLQNNKVKPPVAFLYYQQDRPDRSMYLPLALFSPEYQAIQFAFINKIPCFSIDLPAAHSLMYSNFKQDSEAGLNRLQRNITSDPIAYLARQAGYSDSERWWEIHFEQWTEHDKLFDLIHDLMFELRRKSMGLDDTETLIRERYMRQRLRQLLRKKYKRIAVVCGAWHAPVLSLDFLENHPEEQLKDLKSVSIASCVIPWTYKNMLLENGYSAGIVSPIWHEAIFKHSESASSAFLVHAAHQLRNEGREISPSSAIDAEQLAHSLALLREIPFPGINELMESCQTIYHLEKLSTRDEIRQKILAGTIQGFIDLEKQSLPFVKLFKDHLKKLRLSKFWKLANEPILELDLRKDNHFNNSQFLHFTRLVEFNWAHPKTIESKTYGNFHEHWYFEWEADLEIYLVQIALFGNTIQEVSRRFIENRLQRNYEWFQLANYLNHSLKAGLNELLPILGNKIKSIVIDQTDVIQLSTLIRPLMSSLDYGSIHKIDIQFIQEVLDYLIPKLVIALPDSVKFIDNDRSLKLLEVLSVIQVFFDKYKNHNYADLYKEQCLLILKDELSHPRIQGKIWNLALERKHIKWDLFLEFIQLQFSNYTDIPKAALWFEGFLHNQSAFYLLHPEVLNALDQWLQNLVDEDFKKYLPLLRRVFDLIELSERKRILGQLKKTDDPEQQTKLDLIWIDSDRLNLLHSLFKKLQIPSQ